MSCFFTMTLNHLLLRTLRLGSLAIGMGLLFGCAAVQLPPPTATGDTVEQLRAANLQAMQADKFTLARGKPAEMDRVQGGLRGSSVSAEGGSFAQYLQAVLVAELKAAGLYDDKAQARIGGQLVDSQLDAAVSTGTGRLAARFTVHRDGRLIFDKELSIDEKWESSFIGAVALPEAINRYGQFYKRLVAKLFNDPDFRRALAK